MSIINITYRKDSGEYSLGRYSYYCEIPDIAVDDIVIAPTSKGDRAAKVVEINVPESRIDERIMPRLKTITQREAPDENN
jgi:hypothetical protein